MEYCIGVDIGGTNIAAGIVNLAEKRIVRKASVKTRAPRLCEAICEDIVKLCRDLCSAEGIEFNSLKWIGVATPGIVRGGKVINANNLGWRNVDLSGIMSRLSGIRTFVANDANAAAYAEAVWGAGEGSSSLAIITIGTGVGGGIVIDGKIYEGMNGFAAEIGHTSINADGRYCRCGKRGCLEAYCSVVALVADARRRMKACSDSLLWKICDGDLKRVNGFTLYKAADRGDPTAEAVLRDFVRYLAVGASNIINILQPDVLCIGGGISAERERLMNPLRKEIKRISFGDKDGRTKIVTAKFMNDAGVIGGALLGMQEEFAKMNERIKNIVFGFDVQGSLVKAIPYGNGHINDTRYVVLENDGVKNEYILQKINKNVFKQPDKLMENYTKVTDFLSDRIYESGGDPKRETLNVIKTKEGLSYYLDEDGEYWRLLRFVSDSFCYDKAERPEQFYDSAVAFGNFQYLLRDYPAQTLYETISNFHNTPDRFNQLMAAVREDKCGRLKEVVEEVEFVKAREAFCDTLEKAHREGKLPLKVTHNDTKLNNILFDKKTGKALCVVDLDTVMPGYSVNDFGDSIRFGATTAAEDERDLSKVSFDLYLYELYVKGFIEGAKGGLTEGEIELLPIGAIMMTLECGMRFLTDYLSGDTYFKTSREKHNLDRARNQFKLVSDMEQSLDKMREIVAKYSK